MLPRLSRGPLRSRTHRLLAAATVFVTLSAANAAGLGSTAAAADTTFTAVADTYVRSDQPMANFGTATQLQVAAPNTNGSPTLTTYVKFDVSGLTAAPLKVTLNVFARSTGTTPIKVSPVADTSWTETGLTYANHPAAGTPTSSSGGLTSGTWTPIDVTPWVQSNGTVSFAVNTGATAIRYFDSREGAANTPQPDPNPYPPGTSPKLVVIPETVSNGDPVVAVAGDVACSPSDANFNGGAGTATGCHMNTTAGLVQSMNPQEVFALGDEQYNSGSLSDFNASYDKSWGAFKSKTLPVVGNHEYGTSGAGGYFNYFGDSATPLQRGCRSNCNGYYSFDVGAWHIAVINTECTRINGGAGCAAGSPQATWLDGDLQGHQCTMVLGHRPRWSSNSFASADIAPLISVMYNRGVDLYMTGHSHSYERFAPQNPAGARDDAAGIPEIVVGTGGSSSPDSAPSWRTAKCTRATSSACSS